MLGVERHGRIATTLHLCQASVALPLPEHIKTDKPPPHGLQTNISPIMHNGSKIMEVVNTRAPEPSRGGDKAEVEAVPYSNQLKHMYHLLFRRLLQSRAMENMLLKVGIHTIR